MLPQQGQEDVKGHEAGTRKRQNNVTSLSHYV